MRARVIGQKSDHSRRKKKTTAHLIGRENPTIRSERKERQWNFDVRGIPRNLAKNIKAIVTFTI